MALASLSRSLRYQPKPYFFQQFYSLSRTIQPSLNPTPASTVSRSLTPNSQNWLYQTRRTLILDSVTYFSDSVKLKRLPPSDSGIVEVCLDRPKARNAIGNDMLQGLQHSFEALKEDSSANVVLICSLVPKVFCAGADLKERKEMTASEVHSYVKLLRSTFMSLEKLIVQSSLDWSGVEGARYDLDGMPSVTLWMLDKELQIPTLAVIEGAALGGGLELALSCDLRICGGDAILGLPETGLAIIPGAGGTQRLPRLVGRSFAKELIFTGQKISGKDAKAMGLVNHCVSAGEARTKALEIAREINQKGPLALRMAKRAIDKGSEVNIASGLEVEEECYIQLLHTEDRLEGLAAFAEKRKPRYAGK